MQTHKRSKSVALTEALRVWGEVSGYGVRVSVGSRSIRDQQVHLCMCFAAKPSIVSFGCTGSVVDAAIMSERPILKVL
jgi:hypothetical protein